MNLLAKSAEISDTICISGEELFSPAKCRIMAGPCAAESRDQIMRTAERLAELGIRVFRAGCFKPRTDPYAFQGAKENGLRWLEEVRDTFGMKIITETSDYTNFQAVANVSDIIQIGAKAMYDHSLLRAAGRSKKPVLIKKHFAATVEEMFRMADYALLEGNRRIMFCERGIRTFETASRFTLDLCGAEYMKHQTKAPIILDPSHAMGACYGVPDIAKACVAMGCGGILIEVHHDPEFALCDKAQAVNLDDFEKLYAALKKIGHIVGREVA